MLGNIPIIFVTGSKISNHLFTAINFHKTFGKIYKLLVALLADLTRAQNTSVPKDCSSKATIKWQNIFIN